MGCRRERSIHPPPTLSFKSAKHFGPSWAPPTSWGLKLRGALPLVASQS
jgi:hypothetical protein